MSNVCQYCFGTDLEVHNGALVCVACGQQQQGFVEEVQNEGVQFVAGARRLDINTAPVSKRYVQTKQAEEHLASLDDAGDMRAAVSLYLDALQWLLQHQLDLLADRYGLDSVSQQEHVSHPVDRRVGSLGAYVRKVTGHLWAMQLLRLRALEPDVHETMVKAFCTRQNIVLQSSVFGKTRQRLVAGRHQGGDDGDGGDDQEGSAAGSAQNMPTRAFMDRLSNANAVLRESVDCTHLLVTLITALHFCKTPVSAHDVLHAATVCVLPYLDAWSVVEPRVRGKQGGGLLQYAFRNASVPTINDVSDHMHALCSETKLRLPSINVPVFLVRHTAELGLPEVVGHLALQLYVLIPKAEAYYYWTKSRPPYAPIAALLILAMRIMYGLDGQQPCTQNGQRPCMATNTHDAQQGPSGGAPSWQAWAEGIVQGYARDNPLLMNVHELQVAPLEDVARLCEQLQAHVFGSVNTPREIDSTCALLRSLGNAGITDKPMPTSSSSRAHAMPTQLHGDSDAQHASHLDHQTAPKSNVVPRGRWVRWDAGNWMTRYTPGNAAPAHPDYLAVLAAVAAVVHAPPAQVHEHVLLLEEGLIQGEAAVVGGGG